MGHNQPPEDMALNEKLAAELETSLEAAEATLKEDHPDIQTVAASAGVLRGLLAYGAAKLDVSVDAFMKTLGTAAGGAVILGVSTLWQPVWSRIGSVYTAALEWLNTVTLPF